MGVRGISKTLSLIQLNWMTMTISPNRSDAHLEFLEDHATATPDRFEVDGYVNYMHRTTPWILGLIRKGVAASV